MFPVSMEQSVLRKIMPLSLTCYGWKCHQSNVRAMNQMKAYYLCFCIAIWLVTIVRHFADYLCCPVIYIWCAATDPGDPGIFLNSKRTPERQGSSTHEYPGESFSNGCSAVNNSEKLSNIFEGKDLSSYLTFTRVLCIICFPFSHLCKRWFHSDDQSSEQNTSKEGMFFCSLCKAEVCYQIYLSFKIESMLQLDQWNIPLQPLMCTVSLKSIIKWNFLNKQSYTLPKPQHSRSSTAFWVLIC